MAIFFFGVGLEIKREFLVGELAVLGSRIPEALKVFLVALAIVDDLGALLVIAIFYTASIDWRGIIVIVIVAVLLALWVANRFGARRGSIYLLLGLGLWAGFFMSGLHATLAGVLTALFGPARVKILPSALPKVIHRGADDIEAQSLDNDSDALDPDRVAIIGALDGSLNAATAPLQRFEHGVQPWVTYAILPIFGLFNAGVAIDATVLRTLPTAVPLAILIGSLLAAAIGISILLTTKATKTPTAQQGVACQTCDWVKRGSGFNQSARSP